MEQQFLKKFALNFFYKNSIIKLVLEKMTLDVNSIIQSYILGKQFQFVTLILQLHTKYDKFFACVPKYAVINNTH